MKFAPTQLAGIKQSVSPEEREQAKAVAKKGSSRLVEYLKHQEIVDESQLMEFLSRQLKIDKYSPEKYPPDPELKELIPEDVARQYQLVPLKREGKMLWIGTADPMNINALDHVERITKLEVEPVICQKEQVEELVFEYYGVAANLGSMIGDMEEGLDVETKAEDDGETSEFSIASVQDMAGQAPVVKLVNVILAQAVQEGASDIHISPKKESVQMRYRVDGELKEVPAPPKSIYMPVISRVKLLSGMDIAISRRPQDGRFGFHMDGKEINVRVSSLPTIYGENLVMRLLVGNKVLTMDQLGMAEPERNRLQRAMAKPYGMILATGPTGSGKTTLMYAVLRELDQPNVNIITLEDPVEYRLETIRQVQINRKAQMTFASGLRTILRQDPDTIMVGEIRDLETAQIAVQSAMTGHRMLSTVHTNEAAGAVTRFIDMGVEPFLVASTLLCSVGQRLMRRLCTNCKEQYEPSPDMVKALKMDRLKGVKYYRGAGCNKCGNTGYAGRIGVYEVLEIDEQIQALIVRQATSKDIERAAIASKKFRPMRIDAIHKVVQGVTTLEEAMKVVYM